MKKAAIMSLTVMTIVLASIALTYTALAPRDGGPAPSLRMYDTGATLVYAASRTGFWGETSEIRVVNVLHGFYDEGTQTYHVIIRDSHGEPGTGSFTSEVDWDTREILWSTDPYWEGAYVEYWIPTDVCIGDYVGILHNENAEVIGERRLTVDGIQVDCWALQTSFMEGDTLVQDTWYYEKQTGIWVEASWFRLNTSTDPDTVEHCWAGTLISTNVPLPPSPRILIDR